MVTFSGALPASEQSTVNVAGSVALTPSGFKPEPWSFTFDGSMTSSTGTLNGEPARKEITSNFGISHSLILTLQHELSIRRFSKDHEGMLFKYPTLTGYVLIIKLDADVVVSFLDWSVLDSAGAVTIVLAFDTGFAGT